jgi:hypothetical protein
VTDWYASLVDDCRAALTTKHGEAKQAVIEAWHYVGARVFQESHIPDRYGKGIIAKIAKDLGCSSRNVYYAVNLYERFPVLSDAPWGPSESFHSVCQKHLTGGGDFDGRYPMTLRTLLTCDLTEFDGALRQDVMGWRERGKEILQSVQNVGKEGE